LLAFLETGKIKSIFAVRPARTLVTFIAHSKILKTHSPIVSHHKFTMTVVLDGKKKGKSCRAPNPHAGNVHHKIAPHCSRYT